MERVMAILLRTAVVAILILLLPTSAQAQEPSEMDQIRAERLEKLRARRAERKKAIIERRRQRQRLQARPEERIEAKKRQREDRARKASLEGIPNARRDVTTRPFRKAKLDLLRLRRHASQAENKHLNRQARLRRILELARQQRDNELKTKAEGLLKREDRLWTRMDRSFQERLARAEKLMERTRQAEAQQEQGDIQ